MTPNERIDAYLRAELAREEPTVDPRLGFLGLKAREFYWTLTRLLGLSRLHDGQWRKPSEAEALKLCETLSGDIPAPPPHAPQDYAAEAAAREKARVAREQAEAPMRAQKAADAAKRRADAEQHAKDVERRKAEKHK